MLEANLQNYLKDILHIMATHLCLDGSTWLVSIEQVSGARTPHKYTSTYGQPAHARWRKCIITAAAEASPILLAAYLQPTYFTALFSSVSELIVQKDTPVVWPYAQTNAHIRINGIKKKI